MRRHPAILPIILLGFASGVGATQPDPARHWRAFGDVRAVERAGDSLWVGTAGGLLVYDLLRETFVDTAYGGRRLPSSSVRAIRSIDSRVLVGTDGGLAIFRGGSSVQYTPMTPRGLRVPLRRIRAIDRGPDGAVYISSFGLGLGVWRADTSYTITREDSLLDNKVYGVVAEEDSSVYYATSMGLCAWRDSLWVNFQAGAGIPRGEVRQILRTVDGSFDILVGGRGVYRFDGVRARRLHVAGVFPEDDVATIVHDASGTLWAAGRYGDVAWRSSGFWTPFEGAPRKTLDHPWRAAGAGRDGDLYFGGADGVVVAVQDGAVRTIRIGSDLPRGRIDAVLPGAQGEMWFLSGGRVGVVDSEGIPRFVAGLRDLSDLALSREGDVWAAGRWGVFRVSREGGREFPVDVRDRDPGIRSLAFDARGDLWCLLLSGVVYHFDGEIWLRVAEAAFDGARRLVADASGGVWLYGARSDSLACERLYAGRSDVFGTSALGGLRPDDIALSPSGVLAAVTRRELRAFDPTTTSWRIVVARSADETPRPVRPPAGDRLRTLAFASDGTLYLATDRRLGRVEHGTLEWNQPEGRISGLGVRALAVAPDGDVWVGFERDGLAGFTPGWLW